MKSQMNPMIGAAVLIVVLAVIGFFIYKANRPLHADEDTGAGKTIGQTMFKKANPGKPLPGGLAQ